MTHILVLHFNGLDASMYYNILGWTVMDIRLRTLIAKARKRRMTEKELEAQRVSFAFGNAPKRAKSTKKAVRAALHYTGGTRKRA